MLQIQKIGTEQIRVNSYKNAISFDEKQALLLFDTVVKEQVWSLKYFRIVKDP